MCGDTIKTIVLPFEINVNGAESSATLSLPPLPVGVDEIAIQQVNAFSNAPPRRFGRNHHMWTEKQNT